MSQLPEMTGPADLYYNDQESKDYNKNTRIIKIQKEMTMRAIELLEIEETHPLILDLGSGSGISGSILSEFDYPWIGLDISLSMLRISQSTINNLGNIHSDLGTPIPFKEESFDYAISISVIQWLFQSYKKEDDPFKRINTFFRSLYDVICHRAVLQFYCNKKETEILMKASKAAGFYGGLVVDNEGTKKSKTFLLLNKYKPEKKIEKRKKIIKKRF